jgi:Cyclophilin-like family
MAFNNAGIMIPPSDAATEAADSFDRVNRRDRGGGSLALQPRSQVRALPFTLTLTDFHGNEKISDLPQSLSTVGAPEGHEPEAGDITYYAPWGSLAIFYGTGNYSPGLVKLGRIADVKPLSSASGNLVVRITHSVS